MQGETNTALADAMHSAQELETLYADYVAASEESSGKGFMSLFAGWLGSGDGTSLRDENFVQGVERIISQVRTQIELVTDERERAKVAEAVLDTMISPRGPGVRQSARLYLEAVLARGCELVAYLDEEGRRRLAACMATDGPSKRFLPSKKKLYSALTD